MWFQKLVGQVVTDLPAVPYPRARHSLHHVQRSSQAPSPEGFVKKREDMWLQKPAGKVVTNFLLYRILVPDTPSLMFIVHHKLLAQRDLWKKRGQVLQKLDGQVVTNFLLYHILVPDTPYLMFNVHHKLLAQRDLWKKRGRVVTKACWPSCDQLPAVPYPRARHSLPHVQRSSQASSSEGFVKKERTCGFKSLVAKLWPTFLLYHILVPDTPYLMFNVHHKLLAQRDLWKKEWTCGYKSLKARPSCDLWPTFLLYFFTVFSCQ